MGFFTNGCFILCDNGEMHTDSFSKTSNDLAKFLDKILEKDVDHPSLYYTGKIYKHFRNFKRVTRSGDGRVANEF